MIDLKTVKEDEHINQMNVKHIKELEKQIAAIREHIKVMIRPTTNRYTVVKRCKEILTIINEEK